MRHLPGVGLSGHAGEEGGDAEGLAKYATAALERLAAVTDATLLEGRAAWPEVTE